VETTTEGVAKIIGTSISIVTNNGSVFADIHTTQNLIARGLGAIVGGALDRYKQTRPRSQVTGVGGTCIAIITHSQCVDASSIDARGRITSVRLRAAERSDCARSVGLARGVETAI